MGSKKKRYLLLNGPNLNMLGVREPKIYGKKTLLDLEKKVEACAKKMGVSLDCAQSNHEGEIIDIIQASPKKYSGIIFNPGAYTHYSYAIYDALLSVDVPTVEVHISDINQRDAFRQKSVTKNACVAQISGAGVQGYIYALKGLVCADWNVHLMCGQRSGEGDIKTKNDFYGDILVGSSAKTTKTKANSDMSSNISNKRLERVRAAMLREKIDAFYVRDTTNIAWLTAFDGVFDSERAHALIITQTTAELHTDSRYYNACRAAAIMTKCPMTVSCTRENHAEVLKRNRDCFCTSAHCNIGIEDSITLKDYTDINAAFECGAKKDADAQNASVPISEHTKGHAHKSSNKPTERAHKLNHPAITQTHNFITDIRAIKDDSEIERLTYAQKITDAAFSYVLSFICPGLTEREVQLKLDNYMLTHGAEALAFPSIVATGPNAANPHAIPGNTKLESGQCVVLDFGARARGYCSDMTRTIFLGKPTKEMKRAWSVLRRANEAVQEKIYPGVTGVAMHELAERVLAQGGFEDRMGHGLGHGVGMDIHEQPCLNTRNNQMLKVGSVVTVEPGIYIPNNFGMRLEDFGVIRENGFECFTKSTHEMIVI